MILRNITYVKYSQLKQEQDKSTSKKVLQLGNIFLRCFLI